MTEELDIDNAATITDPFGIYRAEWLNDALFKLFTKPTYYPELETPRPCVLVGGRGTGKTTVLRCLSYEGRFELEKHNSATISNWPYYGFYYRVNTNRVTAFRGEELSDRQWERVFAHYLNLVFCGQVAEFLGWYCDQLPDSETLSASVCSDLAADLYLEESTNQAQLIRGIARGRRRFEAFLNNLDPDNIPQLSLQGQPVDDLCNAVLSLPQFKGKNLFFIVDELENLLDYQQIVLNTLIKHCGPNYTFKIGVRDLGWRKRSTLNENEQLISPADYERIDIEQRMEGDQFAKFAAEVCNLRAAVSADFPSGLDIARILPSLSAEEEGELLGIKEHAAKIVRQVQRDCPDWASDAKSMAPLDLSFVDFWARSQKLPMSSVFRERQRDSKIWQDRLGNYKFPLLFTLKRRKPGIRKYYAGWRTFTLMAGGNIRYLLELVGQALLLQKQESRDSSGEPISPELQTRAASLVGRKNLSELEGLSVHGAQLTKLLLGLGRVFEVLASEPEGHTPEVTQFALPEDTPLGAAEPLLTAAVMHLALVRTVANKRMDLDLKGYDYAVHPIYSAFFVFSYRRKRKLRITPNQLVQLVKEPRSGIREILTQNNRSEDDQPLPDQLRLFEGFYDTHR
ncbi:hypothetical protein J2X48_004620 [Bosea sp. BE271]|uniref:ORC-CDC6 family AAA ATPase n=1 Tax=Bosea TaxID=85413 RepID=UPI0028572701|nr:MULTISPECIES: hypothetical protein [Bosea]MDR6830836.1 hypothetical protein [Bosea robiniae]MDR6897620.1 hypothetical protein [Bosea sp. BE109]MDR7141017.1 hypothetical protein [Bosea sp. BE168]MDR7177673.1 hypothetical protein [Bosea sp. BE271]